MTDYTGIAAAGAVANGGKKKTESGILATARDRLNMAIGALSESREDEIDDLKFYAGSPDNRWQWPADVLATRGSVQGQTINARPCLTINKLPQHVRQVTNDQRQNRPSGKVIPAEMTTQTSKSPKSSTAWSDTSNTSAMLTSRTIQRVKTKSPTAKVTSAS
jgi:hypothetical protein